VIQPNFDIVFLGAAPGTEAIVARFAERVGPTPGLAFRITRASVLRAAEAGATVSEVMEAMRHASTKPVPKNVEREVSGWMAAVRRAKLRVAEVIDCADEETTNRVVALLGTKVRRLGPTLLELDLPPNARTAAIKRLRTAGVFLEDSTGRLAPRPTRERRRAADDWDDELDADNFS
jgi:hypothetical protein